MKKAQFLTFTLLLTSIFLLSVRVATAQLKATLEGHTDIVSGVTFSPDGQTLASVSWDGTVRLWNVDTEQLLHTLTGHTNEVMSVAFSPDGQTVVSGSWDGTIRLWNPNNGKLKRTLTEHAGGVASVVFSPDGQTFASGSADRTIQLWNTRTWEPERTLRGHTDVVDIVAFSPDGAMLASGSRDTTIRLWNPNTGKYIETLPGHTSDILRMMFSPDSTTLASGSADQTVRLWNPNTGKLSKNLVNQTGWVNPVAFSSDGATLLIGGRGISIWDTQTSEYKIPLATDIGNVTSVVFSPDGQMVASGSEDNKVRLWEFILLEVPLVDDPFDITNISEPVPPPAAVREFFQLDPFYQQWINVKGFPVIASAKVSPYALKEAAWVIGQMLGHRPDVLKAMAQNKIRLSVIAYNEIVCDIPEHRKNIDSDFCFFPEVRARASFCPGCLTVTANEENLLHYHPGGPPTHSTSVVLIHEFAHGLHIRGLNTVDPLFDNRLRATYQAAMQKGLWQGNYAASNMFEYWAEAAGSWFNAASEANSIKTRTALKKYDPDLAILLTEVFGDQDWRSTPFTDRMHLPHLQGFNPENSPIFERDPESVKTYEMLKDPNSDGGGKWISWNKYDPTLLPNLNESNTTGGFTKFFFVNLTGDDVLLYRIDADGTEILIYRSSLRNINEFGTHVGAIWLIKEHTGKDLAVFRAEEKTGRVFAGSPLAKITGPWLWMIAPTKSGRGGANSNNVDSLAVASGGNVTEADIAANGAREGDAVGNYVWTLGEISETGGDNINAVINNINMAPGDIDDHSSYALITLESATVQTDVTMRAGSDDSIKIWLNGEVVHNNPINRGAEDFQDRFTVDLKQGDNLLLVKVSEGWSRWSMFVGVDADVNAVYKRPPDPVVSEDVNGDGLVNILDLVSVSSNFGKTGQNPADVNGDGVVNIVDLVKVAGAIGAGAAAPSAHPQTLETLTAADVRHWLTQAQRLGLTDATSQRGILMLQQLLTTLIPKETSLLPNYPNPFNPETWIPYQLSKSAEVKISIYAADGKLVRRLDLGHQPVGIYQDKNRAAHWDGRNAVGEPVASGVYFYTLTSGNFTATRKMLILK